MLLNTYNKTQSWTGWTYTLLVDIWRPFNLSDRRGAFGVQLSSSFAPSVLVQQSTATALQHVSCQLHTICTSGRFANLACCCFKMEMEMQTLQGAILSLPSRLNCFTTYKLLYYFSATREQCRAQQGHCCRTTVMIKERKTALHRQYILLFVP